MNEALHDVYERLLTAFGPQHWWPGESTFEVMVGAILTQNTTWQNVERAIENLRGADALSPAAIYQMPDEELAETIRPAGYYRLKSRRLKNLVALVMEKHEGALRELLQLPADELRAELLSVNGIGPETADSIVLYAAEQPIFVVDAYTARVLKRHGWIEPEADYHAIQALFHDNLPDDTALFNEYHALLVRVGNRFCKPTPKCEECPLVELLPEGGPCEI
jgi:endonuclease-3 related protein